MSTPPAVLVAHPGPQLYGSDRVMLESVDAFLDRGWRVAVTIPRDGPLVGELAARGVPVHLCPTPVLRRSYLRGFGPARLAALVLRSLWPGVRLLRRERPDVVYVSTLTPPLWLLLARLLRIPSLCHVHEGESQAPRSVRTALALPVLLARRVAVNSRFAAGVMTGAVPRLRGRYAVVYNGVRGPASTVPAREHLDDEVRLLYLGRLSERKGVFEAVEAVAKLVHGGTAATLDLVGDAFPGYEWVEEELRRRAEALGIADRVRFRGFHPDVTEHLAAADVVLVPSLADEAFGTTAVEGALAGRPVVASTCGGLPEAIEGMQASRGVPPGSPDAIADAVRDLVANWPAIRRLALDDAQRAADRHAPAVYREAIIREIEPLLPRGQ